MGFIGSCTCALFSLAPIGRGHCEERTIYEISRQLASNCLAWMYPRWRAGRRTARSYSDGLTSTSFRMAARPAAIPEPVLAAEATGMSFSCPSSGNRR